MKKTRNNFIKRRNSKMAEDEKEGKTHGDPVVEIEE